MTATAIPIVKDQELISSDLVESASVNSIADFIPSKFNEQEVIDDDEKNEFINIFMCHLIFYGIFCISLVLHVLFDLELSSFIRKIFIHLIELVRNNVIDKKPAFA